MVRTLFGLALAFHAAVAQPQPSPDSGSDRRLLVIYSTEKDAPSAVSIDSALRATIGRDSAFRIEIYREYLDSFRFPDSAFQFRQWEWLRKKYADRQPDAMMMVGLSAHEYDHLPGGPFFPGVPIVMVGVSAPLTDTTVVDARTTAVIASIDPAGTLDAALRLQPGTGDVVLVAGEGDFERSQLRQTKLLLEPYTRRVHVSTMTGLPMSEILRRVAQLRPGTIVMTLGVFRDITGRRFMGTEGVRLIAEASSVPVYGLHQILLGHGVVGGTLWSAGRQAELGTGMTLQLLRGTPVHAIPIDRSQRSNVLAFDWRALRRWGLDERGLPAGATVLFREYSFWDQYRGRIIAGVLLCLVQAVLIVALLAQLSHRSRAEGEARRQLSFESLMKKLSVAFGGLTTPQLDEAVVSAMQQVVSFTGADRATLVELDVVRGVPSRIQSSHAGSPARAAYTDHRFASLRERLQRGETIRVSIDDPRSSTDERAMLVEQGITSLICTPLVEESRTVGVLALVGTRPHHTWAPDLAGHLPVLARIFGNALLGRRAELHAQQLRDELAHVSRVATMGELASALAHEINQPLTAILAYAQAMIMHLQSATPDLTRVRSTLDRIAADDRRATAIIERLRSFLRKQDPELKRVDLVLLIHDVDSFVRADAVRRGITLRLEFGGPMPAVLGDAVQLQQVLVNLLLNAFDAVAALEPARRMVTVRASPDDGESASVMVVDTGRGIPTEQQDRIFEAFVTTKTRGMGMGLAICRSLIAAHRGELWARNNPGGGATVGFTLRSADLLEAEMRGRDLVQGSEGDAGVRDGDAHTFPGTSQTDREQMRRAGARREVPR